MQITERNKRLTAQLFARFSAGDVPGVLAMLGETATWRVPGKPEAMPSAGVYDKAKIGRLFETMMGRLRSARLRMDVRGTVAEGNRVAAEVVSHGELKNGRVYEQEYHFLIEYGDDGRIVAVREYLDTQHAFAVWLARDPA